MSSVPRQPNCPKCGELKKLASGRWRCRPCDLAKQPEYNAAWLAANREKNRLRSLGWAAANREKAAARSRAWHAANREKAAATNRRRYAENGEAIRAANRAYFAANPEPFRERARNSTWRKDNPEAARAVLLRRRGRKAEALCTHGVNCADAAFYVVLYSSPCTYCGAPAEHADHYIPLAKGGLHCRENLIPACAPCNTSKSDRDPIEWLASRT